MLSNRRLEFTTFTPSRLQFFIAMLIGITGLVIATKFLVIGGIEALFGFSLATHTRGTHINADQMKYKNYIKILGFYFVFGRSFLRIVSFF